MLGRCAPAWFQIQPTGSYDYNVLSQVLHLLPLRFIITHTLPKPHSATLPCVVLYRDCREPRPQSPQPMMDLALRRQDPASLRRSTVFGAVSPHKSSVNHTPTPLADPYRKVDSSPSKTTPAQTPLASELTKKLQVIARPPWHYSLKRDPPPQTPKLQACYLAAHGGSLPQTPDHAAQLRLKLLILAFVRDSAVPLPVSPPGSPVSHTASPISARGGLPMGSTVAIANDISFDKMIEALGTLAEADAAEVCGTSSCLESPEWFRRSG